jgi:hypothetical protein
MNQTSDNNRPYMAPGLIRDKVAERLTTLNPSIRITRLSGQELREKGCPEPEFETNGFFTVIFRPNPDVRAQVGAHDEARDTQFKPNRDQVTDQVKKLLSLFCAEPLDTLKLMNKLGLSHRSTFRKNYLHPSPKAGYVERTIPYKPRSSRQRYRITPLGEEILKKHGKRKTKG